MRYATTVPDAGRPGTSPFTGPFTGLARHLVAALVAILVLMVPAPAALAQLHVKIGVLNDQSGVYSDMAGPGSVVAAIMAAEEFRKEHPGIAVDIIAADHGNKPDLATSIARRWFEQDGVDAIADIQGSSIAVAVQYVGKQLGKVTMATSATTPELTGKACSLTGIMWAMDAYAAVNGPVQALIDRRKWFFLTLDLAGGLLFEDEGRAAVAAAGGTVVGSTRHPLHVADMSAYILQAQASGADVLGLANAGGDTVKAVKAASEFGLLDRGMTVAPFLMLEPDIRAVGLPVAKGMVIGLGYYWDLNDRTRAFGQAFMARYKRMPTQNQAGVYSAVRHYLRSVADAGSTDGTRVMDAMRRRPVEFFSDHPGSIRPDGRVIYDVTVMQVKAPEESKGEWDLLKPIRTIAGEQAFRPERDSVCPSLARAAQ